MLNTTRLKALSGAVLVGATVTLSTPAAAASETLMNLLSILRDRGSISQDEYAALVNAAESEEKEAQEKTDRQMADISKFQKDAGWASKVKIKGDIRLRYQHQNEDGAISRDRGRVRYRLGVIGKPADGLEVGAGLASGSDDQRSTNQSFDESFSTKNIGLDYAYAQYEFTDSFRAIGGKFKFKNYLWAPTDLIWDGDINPEGASASYNFNNPLGSTFLNGGLWVLEEESSSKNDPYMFYAQLGHKWASGNLYGTLAGTYYNFADITSLGALSKSEGTNTDYRFDSVGLSGELGMKGLFGADSRVAVLMDFIKNTDTDSSEDTGYAIGLKGSKSRWGFKYIYADLEANAWPDFLPDSDRFDGLTGIKGHEFAIEYALMKNVELGLDFYATRDPRTNVHQDLLQADVVVKF